jgi:pilus assembly protein Flp/PilA
MRSSFPHGDDTGASAVEYGLLVFAIAAVLAAIVFAMGGVVSSLFQDTCTKLDGQVTGPTASCSG